MKRSPFVLVLALISAFLLPQIAVAEPTPWPHWRGPLWNGAHPDADPPVHFSEEKNVRFKVSVPGEGLASPIIWEGVVYLLSAEAADADALAEAHRVAQEKAEKREWPPAVTPVPQKFLVLAYSAEDGRELWRRVASEHVPHETHYLDASWASATPATDGEMLYAHFGSNGTYAYTLDGKLVWQVDLGNMTTRNGFGEGTSPVIWQDLLLIAWDHEGDSFLVALDKRTGEERWRVERPDEASSWVTPLVVDPDGDGDGEVDMAPQIVLSGTGRSRGYDARTGKELWSLAGMTKNTIPTPIESGGTVYLMSGFRGNVLQAIDLKRAKGELEQSPALLFTHDRHTPYVPSPLLLGDRLYFLKGTKGGISSLNAKDGSVNFTEVRLPGINNVYSSPVAAAGRLYFFDKDGSATVIKDSTTFEVLAENQIDEPVDSSPAIYDDSLFVRSRHHLYRIAADPVAPVSAGAGDEASGQ